MFQFLHILANQQFKIFYNSHPNSYAKECLPLCAPWTAGGQVPLSVEFSRQEYWRGLPFPAPGDLPDPGIEPTSFASPALAGGFFTTSTTWEVSY